MHCSFSSPHGGVPRAFRLSAVAMRGDSVSVDRRLCSADRKHGAAAAAPSTEPQAMTNRAQYPGNHNTNDTVSQLCTGLTMIMMTDCIACGGIDW